MSIRTLIIFIAFGAAFGSCSRPKPQLPSNKATGADSVSTALTQLNSALTEKEDSFLTEFAAAHYPDFTKTQSGFWLSTDCSGNAKKFKMQDKCTFEMKIYSLNGELLFTEIQTINIGRKQTVTGIEESLKMISKGCSAEIILPWYLAWGSKGREPEVPPFTSVFAEIKVID